MNPHLGIRRKLGLTTLLSLVPLLLLGVALSVYLIVDIIRQKNHHQEVTAFESINNVLTFETRMGDSDICFLAALPAVPEIFRARAPGTHDPVIRVPLNKAVSQFTGALSRFLVIKKVYDQVRLIDKSGQEVLRVNLVGGRAEVVPPAQLQNQADRYYFKEAAKLPPRGDYVSLIDLDQEQGKVKRPFKPMLRLAAPIHDEAGVFQGIVILNKYADRFLSHIMQGAEQISGTWFIADEQGNYVYHNQDPHRLWGGPANLNTGEGLGKDLPDAWPKILSGEKVLVFWQGRTWQVHPQRFNLWPSDSRFIAVAHMTPQPGLADYLRRDTWLLASLALVAALLAGLLIWWNARRISQPILDLNQAVVQFSEGQWQARAPVTATDEIGNVCLNFNIMADKLTRLTQNLEDEVKGRTEELREYKDHLMLKVAERTVELQMANELLEREVVERRRGEEHLQAERQRLFAVLEALPAFVILLAPDYSMPYVNRKVRERFGDPAGRPCYEFFFGRQEPCEACRTQKVFETNTPEVWEWTGPDNRIYQIYDYPFTDTDGSPLVLEMGVDITDNKKTEQELRLTQFAVERAADLISWIDPDGRFLYVNESSCGHMGYSREEYGELTVTDVCPDIPREKWPEHFQEIKQQGSLILETELRRKDGTLFPAEVSANYLEFQGREYNVAIARDITARKQAAEALLASAHRWQTTFDAMSDGIILLDQQNQILQCNRTMSNLLGKPVKEIIGKTCWDIMHGTLKPINGCPALRGRKTLHRETLALPADNRWFNVMVDPILDEAGNYLGAVHIMSDITEQKRAEEVRSRLAAIVESSDDGIISKSLDGKIVSWNRGAEKIYGYTAKEALGQPISILISEDRRQEPPDILKIIQSGTSIDHYETVRRRKDGEQINVSLTISPIKDAPGKIVGASIIVRDITAQKKAAEEMQKLSTAVAQASDWVVITNREGIIEYANEAAAAMSGYTREELIGQNPRILKSGQHDAQFYQELWSTVAAGHPFRTIFINRKKNGELFHLDMTITPLRNGAGNITQYLSTAKDITQQVKLEERLNYLAYYDALTGLPNRTLFMDRLRQALARANHSGRPVGVIAMDLDRFKFVNETFGPEAGDEVLRGIGQRLAQTVREGDTVARLGSDEFSIILVDLDQADDIVLVLNRIRESLSQPIQVGDKQAMLTFSMGIAMYPQDGEDVLTLMQNADSAFAKAKEQGGNTYQFYAPGMNVKAANFVLLGNQLLNALHRQEFLLYYQPYYQVSTGKMVGMEALIRWQHPARGLVLPGDFIPILEDTGLIREVGEWTLQEACRQLKAWQQQGHAVVPVSVNFSAVQFSWPGLVGMVERVIGECGLDYHLLTAEITESAVMHNVEYTKSVLTRFKNLGMSVSIDDFGTGYSSLSYLKRFPIDNLKIDVSFIREVTDEPDSATIIQAIISMAHSLDLKTIAEGVETKEQAQILRLLRCDIIQGFYYSHPLPPEEFVKLFKADSTAS